jgi:integrase
MEEGTYGSTDGWGSRRATGTDAYDLRHAAVSTWLSGGAPATTVATWAGHSVEVLLKIYAMCLAGETATVQRRIEAALGHHPVG